MNVWMDGNGEGGATSAQTFQVGLVPTVDKEHIQIYISTPEKQISN